MEVVLSPHHAFEQSLANFFANVPEATNAADKEGMHSNHVAHFFFVELYIGFYAKSLIQAKRAKQSVEQIFYVDCLGNHYLEKKQYVQACKILNCELALFENEWSSVAPKDADVRTTAFYRSLVARLEAIETQFLESNHVAVSPEEQAVYLVDCRQELSRVRKECYALFEQSMYAKAMREKEKENTNEASSTANSPTTPNMDFVRHYDAKYKAGLGKS